MAIFHCYVSSPEGNRTIWFIWKEQHRTAVDPIFFWLAKSPFLWVLLPWFSWGSAGAALFSAAHGERLRLAAAVWSLFSPSHYWRFIRSSSRYDFYPLVSQFAMENHHFFGSMIEITWNNCSFQLCFARRRQWLVDPMEGASSLMKPPAMVATFSRPTSRRHLQLKHDVHVMKWAWWVLLACPTNTNNI